MSDPNQTLDPQQLTQQIAASYVDDYMPPVVKPVSSAAPTPAATPDTAPTPSAAPATPAVTSPSNAPSTPTETAKPSWTPADLLKSAAEDAKAPEAPAVPKTSIIPEIPMEKIEDDKESALAVEPPAPLMEVEKAQPPMVEEKGEEKVTSPILPPEPEEPWKKEVKEEHSDPTSATIPDSSHSSTPTPACPPASRAGARRCARDRLRRRSCNPSARRAPAPAGRGPLPARWQAPIAA